ncbi:hypothetical protein EV191_112107 [Tamaricihabitans halophyticus]|uniref:Uncharacterized protein n=1 Tax=Tamaricihabitans halophyticus TaxID=1262583 RepID=A0A4R2QJU3_9PSEU|nr:hypothetical protein [Tamaricihabitans halophyticus]TCP47311.1 hypothetical protein EV191_112107 [Tamaricihabitans halophyticus]
MNFDTPLDGWFTHLAWNIDTSTRGPFVKASKQRDEYANRLVDFASTLREEGATTAHALGVKVIVPIKGGPRYDLALLVHATEPIRDALLQRTADLGFPTPELAMTASNGGRFGDTEGQDGEILLNHFAGDTTSANAVEAWKSVSDWYARALNVDNSTLLEFTDGAPFLIMNYAVLPGKTVPFLAGQVLRPSFYSVVRKRLHDVGITPYPLIARRLGA